MTKSVAVFRPVITTDEILGTLEALSHIPASHMPSGARSLVAKFRVQALKIDAGIAKPAYIQQGNKPVAISSLTTDDLGDYNSESTTGDNVAASLFGNSSSNNTEQSKPSAELTLSEEAELEIANAKMLAELAANGIGSENVILEDRRKTPRRLEETITPDDL